MKRTGIFILLQILIIGIIFSCADRQDFDQFDDLTIVPDVEASLLYVETPERIINQVSGINFYTQTFNFDAFNEPFVEENILEGVITYEVENTTSKPLDITFEFLDEFGNSLDIEFFSVDAAPTAILTREIAYGPNGRSMDIIRNTSAIRVSAVNRGDNTSVSALPEPTVYLRSSAQFSINLK